MAEWVQIVITGVCGAVTLIFTLFMALINTKIGNLQTLLRQALDYEDKRITCVEDAVRDLRSQQENQRNYLQKTIDGILVSIANLVKERN